MNELFISMLLAAAHLSETTLRKVQQQHVSFGVQRDVNTEHFQLSLSCPTLYILTYVCQVLILFPNMILKCTSIMV